METISTQHISSILEHIEGHAIVQLEADGTIGSWNAGAEKLLGYSQNEIIGQHLAAFYREKDRGLGMPQRALEHAIKNGKHQQTGWKLCKDGAHILTKFTLIATYSPNHEVDAFTLVARDLTDQRQSEQKLRLANARLEKQIGRRNRQLLQVSEKYRHLFEANPLPMWVFDPESFRFLEVNDIACIHYGYSREEFLSMTVLDIRHGKERDVFEKADHPLNLPAQEYYRGTWKHLKKDGSHIEVEIFAHDITFGRRPARMVVAQDITKRRRVEEKLVHNELKLEQAQKMAHFGHWELSFATGNSIWSAEACRIYGLREQDNIQDYQSWLSFVHPEDLAPVVKLLDLARETFSPAQFYHRIVLADGSIKYLFSQSRYEFDPSGNPCGMYGVAHDVTAQKLAEQKIINTNRLYAVISGINQLIVHTEDEHVLFQQVCNIVTRAGKFDLAWIGRIDQGQDMMHLLAHGNAQPEDLSVIASIPYEQHGPIANVLKSGSPYLINDIDLLPKGSLIGNFVYSRGFKSFICLPIQRSGGIYAAINLFSSTPGQFDSDEIALLVEVAGDISFALEVFDRKALAQRAEKRLQHSELRLRQAQAIAKVGSWELDFSDGVAIWSQEHCRIYGLDPLDNRHSFESWLSYIHPDDAAFVREAIQGTGNRFQNASFIHRILRRDGTVRYVNMHSQYELDENGQPVGLYGVSHDITQAKQAESLLVQSETNLRTIMDLLPQRIFVKDEKGTYLFVNESFAKLYGMDPKQLIEDSRAGKLSIPENTKRFIADDRKVIAQGKQKVIPQEHFQTPSGEQKIFHVTKLPYFWGRAREKSVLGILSDITQQKQTENERDTLLAEVVGRNESLEQFAYIVSHNLRAPVANIIALAQLLTPAMNQDPTEKPVLDNLLRSVGKFDEVIRDLNTILQTTYQGSESKQQVSFSEILADVVLGFGKVIDGYTIQIVSDFSQADRFYGIKSYVHSVFFNLISNSIKYRRPEIELLIEIYSTTQGGNIQLRFSDNGMGIDLRANKGQVFGLYKRFHDHVEGKGMGLYMVKRHVEALGGKISLESEVGKGSCFRIELAAS